jgi:hypothetical protein
VDRAFLLLCTAIGTCFRAFRNLFCAFYKSAMGAMVGTKLSFLYCRGLFCCFSCDVDDSASEYSGLSLLYPWDLVLDFILRLARGDCDSDSASESPNWFEQFVLGDV